MAACGGAIGGAPGPGDGFRAGPFEGIAVFPGGSVPSGPSPGGSVLSRPFTGGSGGSGLSPGGSVLSVASPGVSDGAILSPGGSVLTELLPAVQGVFSGVSGIHAFECSVEVIPETFPAPAGSHRGGEGRNPQAAG